MSGLRTEATSSLLPLIPDEGARTNGSVGYELFCGKVCPGTLLHECVMSIK